ncbi:MAG: MMPL family transporter, partial [Dehalococcoidia bacterium]|nr:MMPL family transporter [Dehalococcoidia bacterium]
MIKRYEHTQVGYFIIVAIVAAMVAIGVIMTTTGANLIAIAVLVVLAVALVLFPSLTVLISKEELLAQFGPGVIRKRFKLNEIESCQVVKNHWYYGWGIRLTPHGVLYNVSGFHAV